MAYEIFTRQVIRLSSPTITLNKRGRLVFNVAATKILNDMSASTAFLLWDATEKKFAVKPTSKRDERTVTIRYSPNRKWAAISAMGFITHIGHDMETTKAYPATWNSSESMLEVSMDAEVEAAPQPRPAVVRAAAGQRKAAKQ